MDPLLSSTSATNKFDQLRGEIAVSRTRTGRQRKTKGEIMANLKEPRQIETDNAKRHENGDDGKGVGGYF